MRKNYIRHDNLRQIISRFHDMENVTDESIDRFTEELKHSCLIIAVNHDDNLEFKVFIDDEKTYGLLFTDMDEFTKAFSTEECESHYFNFKTYKQLMEHDTLDGFVLNIMSEGFVLKKELFQYITNLPESEWDSKGAYTTSELKALKESINNHELEKFIENPVNFENYDELFEKISYSVLLTLMLSYDDLDEYSDGDVIVLDWNNPMGFLYIDEVGGSYATVYTSEDKIYNVNTSLKKYSQIVNFSKMCNFVLNDDMDGIIINPQEENIILTRDVLLNYYPLLEDTCNDERLNSAILHMFLMEDG